jgi:hypothetical protein
MSPGQDVLDSDQQESICLANGASGELGTATTTSTTAEHASAASLPVS